MIIVARDSGLDSIRIKKDLFLPIIWSFVGFSFCFLPLRFWTRWRAFKRFHWDDGLTVLAWLLAVALAAIATSMNDEMYYLQELMLRPSKDDASIPGLVDVAVRITRSSLASFMLFYACLWSIKLSFLLFFYRLGVSSIPKLHWHWWGVTVVTILCFLGCFAALPYYCSFGGKKALLTSYCSVEHNMSFLSMKVNCVLDVFTDLLIMTVPLAILCRSRIPNRQKLALLGVFALVLVTIIISIVRATVTTVGVVKQMDASWALFWTNIEANIAIVVACVGSFRMLFIQHRKDSFRPERASFKPIGGLGASSRRTPDMSVDEMIESSSDGTERGESRDEEKGWRDQRYLQSGPITQRDL